MSASKWLGVVSLFWVALGMGEGAAQAEEARTLLICIPDGPGSTAEVAERLEAFLTPLGKSLGASVKGAYHTRLADCDRHIEAESPALVLYPLDLFLERRSAQKLKPVGEPVRVGASRGVTRYHLVAAAGTSLADLSGSVLMSPHVRNPDFFTRVVFQGQADLGAFQVKKTGSAIRALKKLKKGRAQVVLLDEAEHVAMQELPFASSFHTVLSSEILPNAPIAVMGSEDSFRKRAARALSRLCEPGKGNPEACKALEISTIRPVKAGTYKALIKRWKR